MSVDIDDRTVPTVDGDLDVAVAGQGPGLVLVPGLLMSARRWTETGYVEALADRFTACSATRSACRRSRVCCGGRSAVIV